MKFYKYWAKGEAIVDDAHPWKVCVFDASDVSLEDARSRAKLRAGQAAASLARGDASGAYGYDERPLREEIVQEIRDRDNILAIITRNSYGSLVLNTSRVMFVDVDHQPAARSISHGVAMRFLLNALLGKTAQLSRDREQRALSEFENVSRSRPDIGFRVYRTCGGFRLLITSQLFDPTAAETNELLRLFGSDPLYVRLCKAQECFRARLTPKFWRCGVHAPPARFPWDDSAKEQSYRRWEAIYNERTNRFSVCELIGSYGATDINDAVRPILYTHDQLTMHAGATLA